MKLKLDEFIPYFIYFDFFVYLFFFLSFNKNEKYKYVDMVTKNKIEINIVEIYFLYIIQRYGTFSFIIFFTYNHI
jgi:hypothetical protein